MSSMRCNSRVPIKKSWRGVLPIVSVPFKDDGAVDYHGFLKTVQYLHKTSCMGMVLFGIASEFYKLSDYEKNRLVALFLQYNTSKKKIISVTDHALYTARAKALRYQRIGADGLMLLPPFFLQPSKDAIMRHIQIVVSAVRIPVILQIASGETGITYDVPELLDLHREFPHLIFKIEGSPLPHALISSFLAHAPDACIFNGYAGIHMIEALGAGCSGIMPGCSFTELYAAVYNAYEGGKKVKTKKLHEKLRTYIVPWMQSCEYIIAVEKYILKQNKVIETAHCRHPAHRLMPDDYKTIQAFLADTKIMKS